MRVPVPLPYRSRDAAYKSSHDKTAIHEAFEESRYVEMPIAALTSTQRTVHSPPEPKSENEPTVILNRGRAYVHNGHHRTTRAMQRGDRTIRTRVARLEAGPPRLFRARGRPGELLLIHPDAMAIEYEERDVEDVCLMVGDVAVLEIEGPLESKPSRSWWSYFDDYESILARFQAAIESNNVRGILLKIDSPGGSAAGLNECVDAMRRMKAKSGKSVFAYADEGAYSAAYALACVADRITLPRAGGLGSIGVITQMVDYTGALKKDGIRVEVVTSGKRKSYGNPNVPITSAALAAYQDRVDGLAKIYFQLVKDSRGIDARPLEAGVFYGRDTRTFGLSDRVETIARCMLKLQKEIDRGVAPKTPSKATLTNNVSPKDSGMKTIAQLTEAVKVATAALAKAKSSRDKERCAAQLAIDEAALSREMAKKHTVVDKHVSEMEESSSSSESSSESSGSSESESESESEAKPQPGESESESESEEESAVLAMAKKITGKTKVADVIGAMAAMAEGHAKGNRQLARLVAERKVAKIDALIAEGKASHKVTPGNEKKLRALGEEHGYRALRSFLDAAMPAIDAVEPREAEDAGEGAIITPEQRKMWTKMGYSEEKMLKLAKSTAKEMSRLASGKPPKRGEL